MAARVEPNVQYYSQDRRNCLTVNTGGLVSYIFTYLRFLSSLSLWESREKETVLTDA